MMYKGSLFYYHQLSKKTTMVYRLTARWRCRDETMVLTKSLMTLSGSKFKGTPFTANVRGGKWFVCNSENFSVTRGCRTLIHRSLRAVPVSSRPSSVRLSEQENGGFTALQAAHRHGEGTCTSCRPVSRYARSIAFVCMTTYESRGSEALHIAYIRIFYIPELVRASASVPTCGQAAARFAPESAAKWPLPRVRSFQASIGD